MGLEGVRVASIKAMSSGEVDRLTLAAEQRPEAGLKNDEIHCEASLHGGLGKYAKTKTNHFPFIQKMTVVKGGSWKVHHQPDVDSLHCDQLSGGDNVFIWLIAWENQILTAP